MKRYDGYYLLVDGRRIVHRGIVEAGTEPRLTMAKEFWGDDVRTLSFPNLEGMTQQEARAWVKTLTPDEMEKRVKDLILQLDEVLNKLENVGGQELLLEDES